MSEQEQGGPGYGRLSLDCTNAFGINNLVYVVAYPAKGPPQLFVAYNAQVDPPGEPCKDKAKDADQPESGQCLQAFSTGQCKYITIGGVTRWVCV